jgi:multidrug efflux system outer membrane protein
MTKIHGNVTTLLLSALLPAIMAGCTVGPDYKKPDVPAPQEFRGQIGAGEASSIADLPWWDVFNDKALQALITEGLANNNDIKIAIARIEQARQMVAVAQSEGQPQLNYGAFAGGEKSFVPTQNAVGTATFGSLGGMLDAAWEFDIWGRIRRSTEASEANLLAQEDVRRGVMLTLVSDIAAGYFRLLGLDSQLKIAENSSRVFKQTVQLFTLRFEGGRDSKLPVERARAAYDASNASIEDLKRQIALQENAIGVLIGGYPRAIARGRPLVDQVTPKTPVGQTTALLQRRPDILQSEQNMISANAEIGVAVADYFPKIGLSSLVGGLGVQANDTFTGFGVWNIALSAAGPIFSGGRLDAVYHERQAYWDETVADYKKTVQVAFRETSDALASQQTLGRRRTTLENQVGDLERSSDLALTRYNSGRAAYFEVLDAQQQLFPAQDALVQNQRDQLLAVVSLYKALGGGWEPLPAAPGTPDQRAAQNVVKDRAGPPPRITQTESKGASQTAKGRS